MERYFAYFSFIRNTFLENNIYLYKIGTLFERGRNMQPADYILDFVIPAGEKGDMGVQGPIGPTGPQGERGPTGPTMVQSVLSINYNNTTNNGVVLLNDSSRFLYPANTGTFTNTTEDITLTKAALYTFSIFGSIKESTTSEGANLILSIGNQDFLSIILDAGISEISFSKIGFKECNANEKVVLNFNKSIPSSASLENVYIMIQQFYLNP